MISLVFISLGILLTWGTLRRLPRWTSATTLVPASYWALAASSLWTLTWILDHLTNQVSQSVADHLWYACAIIALCPPIAVLGSRRPGTRVWTAFILVPMLFALGWPVITLWLQGSDVRGLQLETPQLVGYLLVLVMGAGNYVGTRYTLAAVLYAVANGLIVLSSSQACPAWLSDRWWVRLFATAGMVVAVLSAGREAMLASHGSPGFDKLWFSFFDQFGIVWGRRIQDRVNFIAAKENWPAKLQLQGFQWTTAADPVTNARIEHTFRWLLRRFVDPDWIDERLGQQSRAQDISPLSADS
ncbi:MAG: hypothetical protein JWP89_5953 [Schlesneria sp.]|nr:hypothetical protein [Schlesneria sp.]